MGVVFTAGASSDFEDATAAAADGSAVVDIGVLLQPARAATRPAV